MADNGDPQPADHQALSDWLCNLREQAGLSQEQAAAAIGVSAREIRRWEKTNAPGSVNLLRLLGAYGVRFEQAPPDQIPAAMNDELRELRLTVGENQKRLARLEDDVREAVCLTREALELLRGSQRRAGGGAQARRKAT